MINLMGRQAMEIAKIKDTHYKLKDKWCEEQETDLAQFFEMVDNLVEAVSNSHQSAMSYQMAQQAKADFVKSALARWSKYRLFEDKNDYRKEVWNHDHMTK